MRIIRRDDMAVTFLLDFREKEMLFELLGLFPITHGALHPISRFGDPDESRESQALLEESLAEHRAEARRELQHWMESPAAVRLMEKGCILRLEMERSEWMLQILNDIRVGAWMKLGAPSEIHAQPADCTLEQSRLWWAMEVSGYFQAGLLAGFDRPAPAEQG